MEAYAGGVFDGVQNCWSGPVVWQLANALGAEASIAKGDLLE